MKKRILVIAVGQYIKNSNDTAYCILEKLLVRCEVGSGDDHVTKIDKILRLVSSVITIMKRVLSII